MAAENAIKTGLAYALVTPARNEGEHIEDTIRSVIAQTIRPVRWVIVSDGSTDQTADIAARYCRQQDWITLVQRRVDEPRDFAAKVRAFDAGYAQLAKVRYDIIGNLDADITFGDDYFSFLLERFLDNPSLGVAGTPFVQDGMRYDYRFTSINHVSGACQLFRSECFEAIGGYTPVRGGGIDWIAVTTARMKGWQTRTFPEKVCFHARKMGTATNGVLSAIFRHGRKDYRLGGHPEWQVFRAAYQMTKKPFIIGGILLLLGYVYASIMGDERPVSRELMAFNRREQMERLRAILGRAIVTLRRRCSRMGARG
jgi:biofilm PGA synthesis N-glycosyltransferase PgaC